MINVYTYEMLDKMHMGIYTLYPVCGISDKWYSNHQVVCQPDQVSSIDPLPGGTKSFEATNDPQSSDKQRWKSHRELFRIVALIIVVY